MSKKDPFHMSEYKNYKKYQTIPFSIVWKIRKMKNDEKS